MIFAKWSPNVNSEFSGQGVYIKHRKSSSLKLRLSRLAGQRLRRATCSVLVGGGYIPDDDTAIRRRRRWRPPPTTSKRSRRRRRKGGLSSVVGPLFYVLKLKLRRWASDSNLPVPDVDDAGSLTSRSLFRLRNLFVFVVAF